MVIGVLIDGEHVRTTADLRRISRTRHRTLSLVGFNEKGLIPATKALLRPFCGSISFQNVNSYLYKRLTSASNVKAVGATVCDTALASLSIARRHFIGKSSIDIVVINTTKIVPAIGYARWDEGAL